jgi:hypothetical protein
MSKRLGEAWAMAKKRERKDLSSRQKGVIVLGASRSPFSK